MLVGEQEFDRPLADVARAPGRTRILLEAVRHAQMHDGIMREPGKQRRLRGKVGARRCRAVRPRTACRQNFDAGASMASLRDAGLVALRQALGLRRIGHRADDGEGEASVVGRDRSATKAPLRAMPSL